VTTWSYFVWLFRQAADGLLYMWPVTAALACLLGIGLLRYLRQSSPRIAGGWLLHVTPLLVPVAMFVVGSVFACENCSPSSLGQGVRHVWAGYIIDALLLGQLAATVLLIRAAKGARFVASALQTVNLWCTFWASFVAGMSISGDWL
jgi:hypothetical protein